MYNISLHSPKIGKYELKYVSDCLKTGWIANGKYIDKFSLAIKQITNSKYAIPCVNGTSGLHIALKVLGINKNHEVIVPTTTFIASINAILYNLASPIFVDIDEYLTVDVKKINNFFENQTYFRNGYTYNKNTKKIIKAIVVVHTFGNAVNLEKLSILCKNKNIKIIEDAAESLGTEYIKGKFKGKHTGIIGDLGCISFNSNKIITAGGGGIILTKNKSFAKKCEYLINQAKDDSLKYIHNEIGYNYRFNNIQASIGYAQLQNINSILRKKEFIHKSYTDLFLNNKVFSVLKSPTFAKNNYWINIIQFKKSSYANVLTLCKKLNKIGIQTRPLWFVNHLQTPFKKFQKYDIKNAIKMQESCICLPSSLSLSSSDIKNIYKEIMLLV